MKLTKKRGENLPSSAWINNSGGGTLDTEVRKKEKRKIERVWDERERQGLGERMEKRERKKLESTIKMWTFSNGFLRREKYTESIMKLFSTHL